jgi:aryl-phospho-beta-D-glucosidase BglC (GH1 family)
MGMKSHQVAGTIPEVFMRFVTATLFAALLAGGADASYLHREGNALKDERGRTVRLTGVNWFGFETSNLAPHGLWSRDWMGMLLQVKSMGFNCIRIPFCDRMLEPGAMPKGISFSGTDPVRGNTDGHLNAELEGKTSLEVMDRIIQGCGQLGLKVILDSHSRDPDAYITEMLWTAADVPEEKWIANWVMLAKRYRANPTVVAFDLDNEPHGPTASGGAQWGTGVAGKDWRAASERCGNAILAENPDVLIVIEGVEQVGDDSYWWGGNLSGVKANPVILSKPEKLVYSAHEYGPEVFDQKWFSAPDFPANMPGIWNRHFGYLMQENTSPVFVGEFGIGDAAARDGKAGAWFDAFLKYLGNDYSWTFWCLNPNSGDTGGILKYDWSTPEQWKLDKLRPYMAPLIGSTGGADPSRITPVTPKARPAGKPFDAIGRAVPSRSAAPMLFRR